jgi:proline dehydrogenase
MLYGTLDETIPYLIRRANENKGMLTGAVRERGIFATEIKRRLSLNNYNTLYK